MIKPLPAIFRWMGIGPVNLASLFQARVSDRWVSLEVIIDLLAVLTHV